MLCPLCGGPVHLEDDELACELGHKISPEEQLRAADHRLAEALWMAVNALDNEAQSFRLLASGDESGFADDAARQADLLRDFARRHAANQAG
jgi:hypothetical protein